MPRKPTVRIKNDRWYSEAGGVGRYLGRVDAMNREEAQALLSLALRTKTRASRTRPTVPKSASTSLTVGELIDRYLAWLAAHRSERHHVESRRHLDRFREAFGLRPVSAIAGADLERFTAGLMRGGAARLYARKHATTIRTAWNRARKAGWIPIDCQPFSGVEPIRVPTEPLLEADLITADEVASLIAGADEVMRDLLIVYHATGARTGELLTARVGDFQPTSRTIVLGRHKRSMTMRTPIPRTLTLNDAAYAILTRRCEGRPTHVPIFVNAHGKPYNHQTVGERFINLRRKAGVRRGISVYSFRKLWISEALMAGVDGMLVAKMAGTSVRMIERVYGHWRTSAMRDAQATLDAHRAGRRG